ncbi:packaged DNA stabilization protein p27 [Cronobacter turicensis]|uniref:packaged DNA stabilization gp4 family protein n=1 Tax=Cronobacter turicensis TaxID=413502 RepID=UPI001375D144|nr:packaged DNA stabilization gp4 family protein [Cronobacter turicensis]NCH64884.1 packaged DNA stabilization protein p27 [Cronobacter turicensis]
MSLTKGDIALFALRKAGIASSATLTDVEPQSLEDAIHDLEGMMAEWLTVPGNIGYIFAADGEEPLPDDDSGLPLKYRDAVGYQLMLRVMVDYAIEPSPRQESSASRAYEALLVDTVSVPSMRRRGDFPEGQGNKYDNLSSDRYYPDAETLVNGDVLNP